MAAELEQVRLSATAAGTTGCWHQSDQPMINNVNYQCATLRGGAPKHADASRRLGLRRPALFLPLFPGCDGRCRSVESIGNVLAYYVTARAAAHAGNLDFLLMMRTDCPYAHHVLQLLPKVVPAPLGGGAPSYELTLTLTLGLTLALVLTLTLTLTRRAQLRGSCGGRVRRLPGHAVTQDARLVARGAALPARAARGHRGVGD